jgi:glycosyltransferase involved in cell wall biosynthesis
VSGAAKAGAAGAGSDPIEQLADLRNAYDLTIFIPCLNEERHVIPTIETVLQAVRRTGISAEILVFDDGSKDRTGELVEEYRRQHPDVPLRLIRRERTMGLARNYVDGSFIARGAYYKQVGGDDSEPLETIAAVIGRTGEADMVLPFLRADSRDLFRRVLSRLFVGIINLAGGYRIRYYNGTAMHRRYNVMRWHSDTYGFAFQAEIITRMLNEGKSYLEVPVDNVEQAGRSSRAFKLHNLLSVGHSVLQILLRRLRIGIFKV